MKLNFHRAHVRLWTWLAENLDKLKYDWPEWSINGGDIAPVVAGCFSCEARLILKERIAGCDDCPIGECQTYYDAAVLGSDIKARTDLANLPWRGRKIFTYKDGEWV